MNLPTYRMEKRPDANGYLVDTFIETKPDAQGAPIEEEIGSIPDLMALYQACRDRWEGEWDLNKVCTAIRESQID